MTMAPVVDGGIRFSSPPASQTWFQQNLQALVGNISRSVVAPEETVLFLLLGLVAQGHVLLEGTPGVGKTLLAKTLAYSIRGKFCRIQGTSDLLPSDVTGTSVFDMRERRFEFRPGPVFTNILMVDEINRIGPRTQSALLEAMAEFQVSAECEQYPLPRPFMVIATQNAAESHGVFPLPDSQLDRFLLWVSLGLPTPSQEMEILSRAERASPQASEVVTSEDVLAMQEMVSRVNVSAPLKQYLVNLAQASRRHPMVLRGISPRGTVLLQRAAQGWAAFEGRNYLIPEDVKRVAPQVLSHRLVPRVASEVGLPEILSQILETVPVPL